MTALFIMISIVLTVCAILYAITLVWMNVFAKCITSIDKKNTRMLKCISFSMIFSFISILASCVLADNHEIGIVIHKASSYFRGSAMVWFIMLIAAMLVRLYTLAMKKTLKEESRRAFIKLYTNSIWCIIIGMVSAFLLL